MWYAAWTGHGSAGKVLVGLGVDVDQPSRSGITPMYVAADLGYGACIKLLVRLEGMSIQPITMVFLLYTLWHS